MYTVSKKKSIHFEARFSYPVKFLMSYAAEKEKNDNDITRRNHLFKICVSNVTD